MFKLEPQETYQDSVIIKLVMMILLHQRRILISRQFSMIDVATDYSDVNKYHTPTLDKQLSCLLINRLSQSMSDWQRIEDM